MSASTDRSRPRLRRAARSGRGARPASASPSSRRAGRHAPGDAAPHAERARGRERRRGRLPPSGDAAPATPPPYRANPPRSAQSVDEGDPGAYRPAAALARRGGPSLPGCRDVPRRAAERQGRILAFGPADRPARGHALRICAAARAGQRPAPRAEPAAAPGFLRSGRNLTARPNALTTEALTNFQGFNRLRNLRARTGRLDTPTLAALRLLPGEGRGGGPNGFFGDRGPGPNGVFEGRVVQ